LTSIIESLGSALGAIDKEGQPEGIPLGEADKGGKPLGEDGSKTGSAPLTSWISMAETYMVEWKTTLAFHAHHPMKHTVNAL
jgi:hypothetical protein